MIGRDIFRCECEVVSQEQPQENDGAFRLRSSFPRGWEFPPILPPVHATDIVAAFKMHNKSLPNLPKTGTTIGHADGTPVRLPIASRDRHTYIVGATGTGKSTLLARMIGEDIERGEGVVLLDPHGDLYRKILKAIPSHRKGDVFLLDPSNEGNTPGVNILDIPPSRFRRRHVAFIVGELFRLFEELWNMNMAGGPSFEMYFRNTLLLLCLQKEPEGSQWQPYTLRAFTKALSDEGFRKHLLANCTEQSVVEFWTDIAEKTSGDYRLANWVPYITCKINGLTQSGFVSDLLSAERNDFRIGERMNQGQIVLVNLNKGLLGTYESRLLGTILMMEIFAAGLQRSALPESKRRPVNVYVDEFQNFVSDNVASMLSEARKFGIRLTLANQTLAQLKATPGRQDLLETVLGNVGNVILFRLGVPDADRLKLFIEPYTRQEMQELPNFHALARILTPDGPVRPLIMKTLKP